MSTCKKYPGFYSCWMIVHTGRTISIIFLLNSDLNLWINKKILKNWC